MTEPLQYIEFRTYDYAYRELKGLPPVFQVETEIRYDFGKRLYGGRRGTRYEYWTVSGPTTEEVRRRLDGGKGVSYVHAMPWLGEDVVLTISPEGT